jgi:hypothetical protein
MHDIVGVMALIVVAALLIWAGFPGGFQTGF